MVTDYAATEVEKSAAIPRESKPSVFIKNILMKNNAPHAVLLII